jgi:hypothetical protein
VESEAIEDVSEKGVGAESMSGMHETAQDLRNELDVIVAYAKMLNFGHQKLPIAYKADYALVEDGDVKAFVEIKCRNVNHDTYDTIILSLRKWHDINEMAQRINIPAVFVIRYDDGVFSIPMRETPDAITIGGRVDRNDSRDIEPVIHYNIDRLRRKSA